MMANATTLQWTSDNDVTGSGDILNGSSPLDPLAVSQPLSNISTKYKTDSLAFVKYITVSFYFSTFLFGILGNSLVLFIITRYSKVSS